MGDSAKVDIWVGVRAEDADIDGLIAKLPKDMFDESGHDVFLKEDVDRVMTKYGCVLERVSCSGDEIGFGIIVFSHDWDYGAAPFNALDISQQIETEMRKLRELFRRFGITDSIGTWCQTDFR